MSTRYLRFPVLVSGLTALVVGCSDTTLTDPLDPDIPAGQAELVIYMELGASSAVSGLLVEVTAPDLANPIIANIAVSMGVGSGTVLIPAGSDRTVTISAFDANGIKTHEGSTLIDVVEGTNPTISIDLEPVFGDVPLQVELGTFVLTVAPGNAMLRTGDAVQLTATLLDGSANPVVRTLVYGSTNPVVAEVDANGLVMAGVVGAADIVVSFGDVQAVATITVTDHEWSTVAVGERHVCGLDQDGAAFCWGAGNAGQLGNGALVDQLAPVPVSGGHSFVSLTAGGLAACGITATGDGHCWGRGTVLGDNDPASISSVPVLIVGGHQWATLEMGIFHACGITVGGETYCWGIGGAGRLGTGSTVSVDVPTLVAGGHSFASVSASNVHTCAVTTGGDGYCWGSGANGRRGDGTQADSDVPVLVLGGHSFSTISSGGHHTCGITTAGAAVCWGWGGQGQLGVGVQAAVSAPVVVSGGMTWTSIDTGARHSCGISSTGDGHCWGFGSGGQIGDGLQDFFNLSPRPVSGGLQFTRLEASGSPWSFGVSQSQGYSCGRTVNSGIFCWGFNNRGQLGDGTGVNRLLPTPVLDP